MPPPRARKFHYAAAPFTPPRQTATSPPRTVTSYIWLEMISPYAATGSTTPILLFLRHFYHAFLSRYISSVPGSRTRFIARPLAGVHAHALNVFPMRHAQLPFSDFAVLISFALGDGVSRLVAWLPTLIERCCERARRRCAKIAAI